MNREERLKKIADFAVLRDIRLEESRMQRKKLNFSHKQRIIESMNKKSFEYKDKLRLMRQKFEEYGKKVSKFLNLINICLLFDFLKNVSSEGKKKKKIRIKNLLFL